MSAQGRVRCWTHFTAAFGVTCRSRLTSVRCRDPIEPDDQRSAQTPDNHACSPSCTQAMADTGRGSFTAKGDNHRGWWKSDGREENAGGTPRIFLLA